MKRALIALLVTGVTAANLAGQVRPAVPPEGEFAGIVQAFLARDFVNDWEGIQKLPVIRWAAPQSELQNCLPDGNCYARQGAASIGGRNFAAVAAGARTIVVTLYLRNPGAPIGEATVLGALKAQGFTSDLVRCPAAAVQGGGTNWYRLSSARANTGVLSIQTSCNGAACEGFVLSLGEDLPPPQPNQVRLYSEQCGAGADRKPISTLLPHEQFAKGLAAFIPAATATVPFDWKTLTSIQGGVQWQAGGPKRTDLSFRGDPNPYSLSGLATYAGRVYSLMTSGTQAQALTVYFEETRLHPAGENVLSVLRADGFTVQLARCGPVYTESSHNWYRVTSPKTKPVVLKQAIRRDGNQFQDSYDLRLDATLPTRDSRDRDPGVSGCQ